jgi:hypothetical protein
MNIRKTALIAPTALLAGAMMLPVGVTAASASPTHTASGAVTQATQALSSTSSTQDWQNGYRDGYRAGWNQAKDDCKVPDNSNHHHAAMVHTDYTDGFDAGFPKGFAAGFPEYCS